MCVFDSSFVNMCLNIYQLKTICTKYNLLIPKHALTTYKPYALLTVVNIVDTVQSRISTGVTKTVNGQPRVVQNAMQ